MKKVIQIVLGILIVVLIFVLYRQVMTPLQFQKEYKSREAAVIGRIVDIRAAEQAYKSVNSRYTGSFDTLIHFVLNDSLTFEKATGSMDDSVAVARGLVKIEQFRIPVVDTVFGRRVTEQDVRNLPLIPFSQDERYSLAAGNLQTESGVVVPVFEARAPFRAFLWDLDEQELINLVDEQQNTLKNYPGIKVGDLTRATNDAGNWGE